MYIINYKSCEDDDCCFDVLISNFIKDSGDYSVIDDENAYK